MSIIKFIRNIFFFFLNFWDLKFDFPFPPKKLNRIFNIYYWNTFFHLYRIRKIKQKKYNNLWADAKFKQSSFENWTKKIFLVQNGTAPKPNFIEEILGDKKFKNVLDFGCGSGASSVAILLKILEARYPQCKLNKDYDSFNFVGIDINQSRIAEANIKVPVLFNYYKDFLKTEFIANDLLTTNYSKNYFDYSFVISVFDYLNENQLNEVVKKLSYITKKAIIVVDFADNYPMNYPRSIKKFESIFAINSFDLKKNNFRITESFPENIRNQLILEMFFEKKI